MKNILKCFVVSIFLLSCSTTTGLKPRGVEEYYVSTGVERYFLSDIPEWANFSQAAGCFRTKGLRYFDISALMSSYALTYFEAIQLQALFNEEFSILKSGQKRQSLTLKEEENLFFKASERVSSKIYYTDMPTYKRIHLIWVDEVIGDKNKENKLATFLQSSVHNEGVPVLISSCLDRSEIEKMFPDKNHKILSAELYSIYDAAGTKKPSLHIDLKNFFKADQKLIFYNQGSRKEIMDILGNYKVQNY